MKLITIFGILLVILASFAMAEEQADTQQTEKADTRKADQPQLDALKNGLKIAAAEFLAKLDASIKVAKEKGVATVKLESLREEFSTLEASIAGLASRDDVKELREKMHNLAEKVRESAKKEKLSSHSRDIKKAVDEAIKEKKEELDKLKETALEARKKALLRQYEDHLEHANKRLARMKELGLGVAEIESKL